MVKIDVCTLTSVANARILDEHRPTRDKRKGDEVLCMTKLDVLTIYHENIRHEVTNTLSKNKEFYSQLIDGDFDQQMATQIHGPRKQK